MCVGDWQVDACAAARGRDSNECLGQGPKTLFTGKYCVGALHYSFDRVGALMAHRRIDPCTQRFIIAGSRSAALPWPLPRAHAPPCGQAPVRFQGPPAGALNPPEYEDDDPGPLRRSPAQLRAALQRPRGGGAERRPRQPGAGLHDRVVAGICAEPGAAQGPVAVAGAASRWLPWPACCTASHCRPSTRSCRHPIPPAANPAGPDSRPQAPSREHGGGTRGGSPGAGLLVACM